MSDQSAPRFDPGLAIHVGPDGIGRVRLVATWTGEDGEFDQHFLSLSPDAARRIARELEQAADAACTPGENTITVPLKGDR